MAEINQLNIEIKLILIADIAMSAIGILAVRIRRSIKTLDL